MSEHRGEAQNEINPLVIFDVLIFARDVDNNGEKVERESRRGATQPEIVGSLLSVLRKDWHVTEMVVEISGFDPLLTNFVSSTIRLGRRG